MKKIEDRDAILDLVAKDNVAVTSRSASRPPRVEARGESAVAVSPRPAEAAGQPPAADPPLAVERLAG